MKMEQTECSETSAHKIQTPGNYPEENIQQITGIFLYSKLYSLCVYWSSSFSYLYHFCYKSKQVFGSSPTVQYKSFVFIISIYVR